MERSVVDLYSKETSLESWGYCEAKSGHLQTSLNEREEKNMLGDQGWGTEGKEPQHAPWPCPSLPSPRAL